MSKRRLAQLLTDAAKKAESSREITCPHCNQTFTTSWRTDETTSVSDENADEDNEGDGVDGAEQDNDEFDNRTVARLNTLAKSLTKATERAQR
jgi:hypothetical protein